MRKFTVVVALAGLLGLLVVTGDALSQRGAGRGDPGALFDRVANGQQSIAIADLPPRLQGMLSKYAQENGLTSGQITREQFTAALASMQAQGGRPRQGGDGQGPGGAGMPPGAGLGGMPGGGGRRAMMMDPNNPGMPGRPGRMQRGNLIPQPEPEKKDKEEVEARPVVYHAGNLPKELPPWFEQYDADHDGQISLYEWRLTNEPLEKFQSMDRNSDGFLTPEEVLHHEQLANGGKNRRPTGTQTVAAEPRGEAGMGRGRGQGGRRAGMFRKGPPPGGQE